MVKILKFEQKETDNGALTKFAFSIIDSSTVMVSSAPVRYIIQRYTSQTKHNNVLCIFWEVMKKKMFMCDMRSHCETELSLIFSVLPGQILKAKLVMIQVSPNVVKVLIPDFTLKECICKIIRTNIV